MRIMIVAAHPDDEVLGCGATAARLAREGHELYMVILGEGMTARYARRGDADPAPVERLHTVSHEVGRRLGAKAVVIRQFPDNRFDTVPLLDVVKTVEALIEEHAPEVVYTHHGGDLKVDHRVVNHAVLTATRPVTGHPVTEIYAFEVPSSTDWAFQRLEPVFRPNVFVDVAGTLELKLEALAQYESEVRASPHPRSPRATARRWGSVVGCEAAEAFELLRSVRR